jgi:hypothetical protein
VPHPKSLPLLEAVAGFRKKFMLLNFFSVGPHATTIRVGAIATGHTTIAHGTHCGHTTPLQLVCVTKAKFARKCHDYDYKSHFISL